MKLKDFRLDAEGLFAEVAFGHGFAHYGYWPDGLPEVVSLAALGEAQQAYFDHMAAAIPADVQSILDVGSGTGSNARALVARGYRVECVCPSEQLNAMARAKLGPEVAVHTATFEAFEADRQFDMCLFAESFHYIALREALAQAARYARRHVLIFDYFRRAQSGYADDTRRTHADFVAEVARQGVFEIVRDDDLTAQIAPTFHVLDTIKNDHVVPFVERLEAAFLREHPVKGRLLRRLLGRRIDRFKRPSDRFRSFPEKNEYRLILMTRRD